MAGPSDRGRGVRRRASRPVLEGLESRRLLTIVYTGTYGGDATQFVDGPDGNLWFTDNIPIQEGLSPASGAGIGRINPTTGDSTIFPLIGTSILHDGAAGGITTGPDGNLWFTAYVQTIGITIGVINPTTTAITYYPLPAAGGGAAGIATGSDGNLWFTLPTVGKIGSINPTTHAISEYPLANAASGPGSIVNGPDGKLWFLEGSNSVGSFDPTTLKESEYTIPTSSSGPASITRGPGGDLWFAETDTSKIASIDPATGAIVEYPIPQAPVQVVAGKDGDLYYSSYVGLPGTVGRGTGIGVLDPTTARSPIRRPPTRPRSSISPRRRSGSTRRGTFTSAATTGSIRASSFPQTRPRSGPTSTPTPPHRGPSPAARSPARRSTSTSRATAPSTPATRRP